MNKLLIVKKLGLVVAMALLMSTTVFNVALADDGNPPQPTLTLGTMEAVKAFVGNDDAIMYHGESLSPYAPGTVTDIYYVGTDQYEVDITSVQVIQFGPRPLLTNEQSREYDTTDRYTSDELEVMAVSFITKHAPDVDLNALIPAHGNKEEINYFFRWEDSLKNGLVGIRPFIQVGFSRGGDLLSYTNTLGLVGPANVMGDATSTLETTPSSITSTTYIYSNNGNYYTEHGPSQYWYQVNNEGYCGHIVNWCSPNWMKYTWAGSTLSNWAQWNNIDVAQNGSLSVFVPRVYATTRRAPYYVRANSQTYGPYLVDQFVYYDTFVPVVQLYNIQYVELHDDTGETNKQIGFDEIEIIYP